MPLVMIKSDPRAREKPCLRCGYSLRKIDATHCPECGLSVWLSLNNNDGLDASRPEWLRRMATALWAMAAAQLVGLIAFGVIAIHRLDVSPTRSLYVALNVGNVCTILYLVAYHVGLVALTLSERRYPDRLKPWRIAAWIVSGVAGLVALGMLAIIQGFTTFLSLQTLLTVILLASAVVTLGHLRHLARRIPNSTLARICGVLMFLPIIPLLKVFPFFGLWLVFEFFRIVEFLPLLYLPVSAILFIRFAILFRRAAAHAEQHWQAETAASASPVSQPA